LLQARVVGDVAVEEERAAQGEADVAPVRDERQADEVPARSHVGADGGSVGRGLGGALRVLVGGESRESDERVEEEGRYAQSITSSLEDPGASVTADRLVGERQSTSGRRRHGRP
jgi:hypothetical protein